MPESDAELVRRTLGGDVRAFGELVRRHQDEVFGLISRLMGASDEVEDIAQDAFLRAYRALGSFRGEAQFGTWLYRIAWNCCLDHRARRARRQEHEHPVACGDEEAHRFPDDDAPLPDALLEADETRMRLREQIGRLPLHYRAAVVLYYFEGKSYEEIAHILGVPMNTVKVHLHRAKARLKKALLAEGAPEEWGV